GEEGGKPGVGQPGVGIGDGAFGKVRCPAPGGCDGERRLLFDLDLSPQAIEIEPPRKLVGLLLCNVEEISTLGGHYKEVEQDLSLRAEQPGMDPAPVLRLADIVGDQPLQIFARVSSRDADHATPWKKRRMAMAHIPPFCYQGPRHLWERAEPRKGTELQALAETFDLVLKGGTVVNHAGEGLADLGVRDGRIAA